MGRVGRGGNGITRAASVRLLSLVDERLLSHHTHQALLLSVLKMWDQGGFGGS